MSEEGDVSPDFQESVLFVKRFRHTEANSRPRNGLQLIAELLDRLDIVLRGWQQVLEADRQAVDVCILQQVSETLKLLGTVNYRGCMRSQIALVERAARCAFQMLKVGLVECFVRIFLYVYPVHENKVHESLLFFHNADLNHSEYFPEVQFAEAVLWDGYSVPLAVLHYMKTLLSEGWLEILLQEFERAGISSQPGCELLSTLSRLLIILPHEALSQTKEFLLRALNSAISTDGQHLRKLDKKFLLMAFHDVIRIDRQLNAVSVDALGQVGLSLLKSSLLDKRIGGSMCLNLLCQEYTQAKDSIALELRKLLISNGILELLFGRCMHGEVSKFKRCTHIVRLIFEDRGSKVSANAEALFLWHSLFDRHSDMFEPCYEAFQFALRVCSEQILDNCLHQIITTNDEFMNVRPRTLSLLTNILERGSQDSALKKSFVVATSEYLLNLQIFRSDDPVYSELVLHAKSILFGHALTGADVSALFKSICRQCIVVLNNPSSTSCKILEFLLEFYTKTCVDSCESELMAILVHVLDALCNHPLPDGYSSSMFTYLSHDASVHLIGPAQEDKLWHALAIDTADEVRRQRAFEFILQSKNLSTDVQRAILEKRLPQLPASCMTLKALECLFYLITSVNMPQNRSQVGIKRDRADSPDFTTASNIIGLDTLWRFCLSCPNANTLQVAVGKFSGYIIESCSVHPGSFKSVVHNCVNELRSLGSDSVKARNIISLMLDMSRSTGAMLIAISHERYFPLGHFVQQPSVLVIIENSSSSGSMYCSPVKTIGQLRADLALRFNNPRSFEVLFQIANSDGSRNNVKIDDLNQSNYIGRYGPVIHCQVFLNASNASNQGSSAASRVHLRANGGSQPGKQKKVPRSNCEVPRVPVPTVLLTAATSNAIGRLKQGPPVVLVPFDDAVLSGYESDSECVLCKPPSPLTECLRLPGNQDFDNTKECRNLELLHYPWSIFTENPENYQVLFELGSLFPNLNALIWELLLLLPLNVEYICRAQALTSQHNMFIDLKSTLEKIYFLACVTFWKDLPPYCFDQQADFQNFFSSVAVAALDTTETLQCSVSLATADQGPSDDLKGHFGSLLLSYHLSAITTFRRETNSHPNLNCTSYTLVLLSAGVIGLSNGEIADTLDMFIQSVLNRFEQGLPLCHISGSELMLSAAAANIIDPLSMTQVDLFLKSFSEIASSRRILIIRLLLSSLASRKTLLTPWIPTCIMNIVNGLMFSCHQSDLLNCIVEFIQKDAFMFSHCVQFHWLQTILSNHVSKHESTSVQFLLKTSMRVAAGIRKYIGIAKRDSVMRDCHVACHFIAETFILRLLPRLQDRSHPVESTALDQEFLQHFHDILVITAFPQQVSMQSLDIPHDLKTHVSFPRPPALMFMSPLVTKEDLVCSSFCQFVREATQTLPGVSSVVFETFLQQSAGILSNRKASPYSLPSDPSGFLGLLNLGCTCYFNSITQQLFMIPGFAASVISARVKVDAVDAAVTSEQVIGDVPKSGDANVLARGILDKFQELMVYLRHGAGPVVLPHFFCDSFRFPDGSCILPDVQQDALEFFHILCDHLDNALKGGHDEKLLSRFFGGRSATQLICKGCPHRYERFEHFFTLQLAVFSNRANSVLGALHEFVAGELLEGDNQYFCSLCDKKVDTVKRTVLADLPDTIILGLKRFDFNYDTMQRIKLNVEVPFDHDLDMFPFCRENMGETPENSEPALKRERGYYEYSLAGIVVHSGMADSGHYFSIIRDQNGLWHKFNDDIVSTIQQLDLSQFFGGQSLGKSVHTNAYILVYNRKVPMFQHQYGAITAIESAVSIVQDSQVLTMDKMFVNSLRIGQLWSVFGICIQEYLSTSENEEKGIMYVNFLLKLSVRSPFDVAENMALYLQPLKGFLSSAGKCSSILEHFFSKYHSEHLDVVHNDLFQPIWDSESRQFPALPVFFTQLLIEIITNVKDGKYKLCDPVVCQTIFLRILDCCGNVSWGLYSLLKDGNPLDVDPTVALIAYAVNFFFLSAFHLGLADIILECCSLDQPIDGTVTSAVVKMCVTFLYFANVSEFGPKLRSKRRAHLRKLVQECRRCAFFCFLRLFDKCLSIGIGFQAMLPLQLYASIIFDSNAEYLINHLRIPEGISGFLENQVEEMFYNTAYNILMRMPALSPLLFESLILFARKFCHLQHSFSVEKMAELLRRVVCTMSISLEQLPQNLSRVYDAAVEGYVDNMSDADLDPPYHAYRMLMVVLKVDDRLCQDLRGQPFQPLQDYIAAIPSPTWNHRNMLYQALDSRDEPPCFDDGSTFSTSALEALRGSHFFVPILHLLQVGAGDRSADSVAES